MFRVHRWIGLFAACSALAFVAEVGLAQTRTEEARPRPQAAAAYREDPSERAPVAMPELPGGAEELLGLSVLAAILYGLRASELGRHSRPSS